MKISKGRLFGLIALLAVFTLAGCAGLDVLSTAGQGIGVLGKVAKPSGEADPKAGLIPATYRAELGAGFDRSWKALNIFLISPKNTILAVREGPTTYNGVGKVSAMTKEGGILVRIEIQPKSADRTIMAVWSESARTASTVTHFIVNEFKTGAEY